MVITFSGLTNRAIRTWLAHTKDCIVCLLLIDLVLVIVFGYVTSHRFILLMRRPGTATLVHHPHSISPPRVTDKAIQT